MRVRKARAADLQPVVEMARRLELDYPGMEDDTLWIAEDGRGRIVGAIALKRRPDCLELCALGVEPGQRGRGIGRALVRALLAAAPGTVYLATIIPGFFETCGFVRTSDVPRSLIDRRRTAWCDGCDQSRCTVMLREAP